MCVQVHKRMNQPLYLYRRAQNSFMHRARSSFVSSPVARHTCKSSMDMRSNCFEYNRPCALGSRADGVYSDVCVREVMRASVVLDIKGYVCVCVCVCAHKGMTNTYFIVHVMEYVLLLGLRG